VKFCRTFVQAVGGFPRKQGKYLVLPYGDQSINVGGRSECALLGTVQLRGTAGVARCRLRRRVTKEILAQTAAVAALAVY
jgi:hypothetical protein